MSSVSYRNFTGTGAENYQRYFVPAIATPVSADLLRTADLQPGERVLDVACGTRTDRPPGRRAGRNDRGGDGGRRRIAPDMIDVAKAAPSASGSPIDWHVGDATSLQLPDDSYDAILCQLGLMFMEDRPAALAEMRRVLAPGGRIVVNTPGSIQPTFELMEQAIVEHIGPELGGFVRAVFSMHDPDAVATLLRNAGLDDVSSTVSTATFRLPPAAEFLWQYINMTPMGPFVAQAPEAAQSAMERQVVDRWQSYVVGGATLVDQPMVIATGRK
jgi:SAM-dependent methyltransferase